jgi:hypothetical protein
LQYNNVSYKENAPVIFSDPYGAPEHRKALGERPAEVANRMLATGPRGRDDTLGQRRKPKAADVRICAPSGVKTPVGASRAQSKARSCRETFDRARGALYAPGELGERPSAARRAGRGGNKQRSGGPLSHRAGAPGMAHPGYEGVFARSGGSGFGDFCRNKVCPRRSSHKPVRCRHSGESRNPVITIQDINPSTLDFLVRSTPVSIDVSIP